ncbi:MAG: 16S rRNA (uracil(1498)-N(3))-methyltransferase, partial [Candidatus Zixiibacteriota bacterium]
HALKVLRLKRGALVIVVDGTGNAYRGSIERISAARVVIRVHAELRNFGEPGVRLTLAAGMSVGCKPDEVVQRATELGMKRFVPILSDKSKVELSEPSRIRSRVRRLERVALSAIKQCRRSYLPEIAVPCTLEDFLARQNEDDCKLLFDPGPDTVPLDAIELGDGIKRVTVLVGPESGFSSAEVEQALSAGFRAVSLGDRVLRADTAGPAAVALVMYRLGEFK